MSKEYNQYRAQVAVSRHNMVTTIMVSFFALILLGTGISGCTYYNIEKLKVPVKVTDADVYERGARDE
jgi:hypothetical protein